MTSTIAGAGGSLRSVDLADPDTFSTDVPHDGLAELRRTDPVHWQPMRDEPGFWATRAAAAPPAASRWPHTPWTSRQLCEGVDSARI